MEDSNYLHKIYLVLLFVAILIFGFICKMLSSVLLPVIFAIVFSFVLLPVIKFLKNKCKIPWTVSCIFLVIVTFFILFIITSLLVSSLSTIAVEYPKYESKFMSVYKAIAPALHLEVNEGESFINNVWQYFKVREYVQSAAISLSNGVISFGKTIVTVLLLMVFLLLEMKFASSKLNLMLSGEANIKAKKVINRIIEDVIRFMSIKFIVSFATALLVYFVCLIFGMDFPIVWAFIAFVMNFIPIFGSIISCGLTTLFAILQFYPYNYGKIIAIFLLVVLINFSIGNIIEPRIEGNHLGLSPFIILFSLSIWGYIWGFAGMVMAVPIMVIIKIICENIDYLKPFAVILGNTKQKED